MELGCGYGDFIGNVVASHKAAIEIDRFFEPYLDEYGSINILWGDSRLILASIEESSYDVVFCSNYFEHFELSDVESQLHFIRNILSNYGKLIVLQPNFQLCANNYFDDWTHKSIFSHLSFSDLLAANGYVVEKCCKKFLPFSFKSRFPINRLFTRLYLCSPYKPFATQFLIVSSVVK